MAHYQFVVLCKPEDALEDYSAVSHDGFLNVDGIIRDGEVFSLDTLRWMLPEMSEEKRKETFQKILNQKIKAAEDAGLAAFLYLV